MHEENHEENKVECAAPCQAAKTAQVYKKTRAVFRFISPDQDVAINLEHVYKIVCEGKSVKFLPAGFDSSKPFTDSFEFESEEAAKKAHEQIMIGLIFDVLE
jgi:hypothetical protein